MICVFSYHTDAPLPYEDSTLVMRTCLCHRIHMWTCLCWWAAKKRFLYCTCTGQNLVLKGKQAPDRNVLIEQKC